MKKQWSVPFITETTEIWEVEANTKQQAQHEATMARAAHLFDVEHGNESNHVPTHSHVTKFQLGTIRETVGAEALTRIAGGSEHAGDEVATRRIKDQPQA